MDTIRPQLPFRISFSMICPDPPSLCSGVHLPTKEGWLICSLSLEFPSPTLEMPLLPEQLKGSLLGQAILDLPTKIGLLLSLCSHGTKPEHLLTLLASLQNSDTYVCCLGYVITSFEIQMYVHISFY